MAPDLPDKTPGSLGEYQSERDMDRFWREVKPRREPLQKRWFLPLVFLILAVQVPWYWRAGATGPFIGGLPLWIWIAIVSSVAMAGLTAFMGLRHWDDDEIDPDRPGES